MRYDLNLLPVFVTLMEERNVTRAAQRLVQYGANSAVVVADQNCRGHQMSSARALGNNTRNMVRPGTESHSITPP